MLEYLDYESFMVLDLAWVSFVATPQGGVREVWRR